MDSRTLDVVEPVVSHAGGRDYYKEFLSTSRWLGADMRKARSEWLSGKGEEASQTLFRFEMMLKGITCFANGHNHPGLAADDADRDFRPELSIVQAALEDALRAGKQLCGDGDSLQLAVDILMLPEAKDDAFRVNYLVRETLQENPQQSLLALLSALDGVARMLRGMLEPGPVAGDQFTAVCAAVCRETLRSSCCNPLTAFEFREEFDAILLPHVLPTIASLDSPASGRVSFIAILSLLRLLHYIELIDAWNDEEGLGPVIVLLALLRSDGEAYAAFLSGDTSNWMATDFEEQYASLTPRQLRDRFDELHLQFEELKSLRELLESTGHQLDLELKKAFVQQIPPISAMLDPAAVMTSIRGSITLLRSFLQNAVVLLVREFNVGIEGDDIFGEFTSDATRSERLRRDVWMFRQILKAFVAKTKGAEIVGDRWAGLDTFRYVKTFVDYFRSMGYQLLRYSDYDRFDKFIALIDRLREGDALEVQRLSHVMEECESFYVYLDHMFEAVSQRRELEGVPFDAKDAARTLKLFIE